MEDLYIANITKNEETVKQVNNALIDLRNNVNKKDIPEKENHEKVVDIVEEILSFNENNKGKGLKIVTPNQIIYLKERKSLRDKFLKISEIFDKLAKLNPSEKSTGSQFTKLNSRENASFFRICKF